MRAVGFACILAAVAAAFTSSFAASAQDMTEDEAWCWDTAEEFSPEQQIAGCNALLAGDTISDEERPYAVAMRGWSRHELQQYDEAIADFSEKIRLQPEMADGYGWRATALFDKGEFEQARTDYSQAIKLGPADQDIAVWHINRGLANLSLGDDKAALRDFDEAEDLSGPDALIHAGRGDVYFNQKKYRNAIAEYSAALELSPDDSILLNTRCWTRAIQGQELDLAMEDCDQALAIDPGSADAYDSRGLVNLKQENWEAAQEDYNAARSINPAASAYFGHAIALSRQGLDDEAQLDFEQATEMDPKIEAHYSEWGIRR